MHIREQYIFQPTERMALQNDSIMSMTEGFLEHRQNET